MDGQKSAKKLTDRFVDFLFSDDARKHLLWIVPLGFILRIIIANNVHALGDEMIHGPRAINFLSSGLLSTILQAPLWLAITDIFQRMMGVTMISARMGSVLYGTLTIIVVYLIANEVFKKKTLALLSALVFAVSHFVIRFTLIEMDLTALFFLMLALYLTLVAHREKKFPYMAAIAIGLAALIKTLSLFFVPAFLLSFFYYYPGKKELLGNIKKCIYFGLIIILLFSPILIHNYLWYRDAGLVDTYFAQYFAPSIREVYAGQLGYSNDLSYFLPRFFEGSALMAKEMWKFDKLIIPLAAIGIVAMFFLKDKRKEWVFLLSFIFFGFVLLILSNWLHTHYTTLMASLSIFAAYAAYWISKKLSSKGIKKSLMIIVIILLIVQLVFLWPSLTSRSGLSKMKSYANNEMDKNSVVITDPRIYRGRVAWLFHDFHYLEGSYFYDLMAINQNASGPDNPTKIYFVECARDDCGWGTVTAGSFNDTSEQLVGVFSNSLKLEKSITPGKSYSEETGDYYFKVYSGVINLKPGLIEAIDSTHIWFYYPMNYEPKEQIYEQYSADGPLENFLYLLAWTIFLASIILAFLMPVLAIYEVYKQRD
jgi:hypothetical protein